MSGNLTSDPLFVGLTRPPMIFGVSIKFAGLNMMISLTMFIQSNGVMILFISGLIHFIGYLICFKEPRCIEILLTKSSKCSSAPNKSFYGANSYGI